MTESPNEISISFKYNEKKITAASITELKSDIINSLNHFMVIGEEFEFLIRDIDSCELGQIAYCDS